MLNLHPFCNCRDYLVLDLLLRCISLEWKLTWFLCTLFGLCFDEKVRGKIMVLVAFIVVLANEFIWPLLNPSCLEQH